ncbi:hypothetical protein TWF788_003621 [Orbilia oligospora]|uniref:G domain-containing protein n=1 Tax=Orbilia oligospora TaxID=2813651 RepID=A0A7C8PZZ7_ORBOL|nr:hypothetical protein TWF788_003621 [Orbilia oligospora]
MEGELNILLIGPSQNGKSTFINKIRQLSEYEPESEGALEGDGSQSCTKTCKEHIMWFRRTRYKLVDIESSHQIDVSEDNEDHLFHKIWKRKTAEDCEIFPLENNPRTTKLRLIDTPGLDDSQGSDDRNIVEVMMHLKRLSQAGEGHNHLTAIVFVLSSTEAFSGKLQNLYQYYQRCMPSLFGGLAVVNTRFSVEEWLQRYNSIQKRPKSLIKKVSKAVRPDSARIIIMRERREEFLRIFGQDARHFYIDSVPDDFLIVEELITRNHIYDIINYFASQNPMPILNIKLVKSTTMLQIDEMLAGWLKEAKSKLTQRETVLLGLSDASGRIYSSKIKRALTLENELEQMKKELAILDNESKFTIRTHSTAPLHKLSAPKAFWKWAVRTSIKDSLSIEEPDHPGFTVEASNNLPYSQWTTKDWNQDRTVWTGGYSATPGQIPILDAVVSISNRKYYRTTIEGLNKRILQCKEDMLMAKEDQAFFSSQEIAKPMNPELKEISEILPQCDALINQLCLDWNSINSGLGQTDLERYRKVRVGGMQSLSIEDLFEFCQSQGQHSLERKLRAVLEPDQ